VVRTLRLPARLSESRETRSSEEVGLEVETLLRVVPGVPRVELDLRVENSAEDHRLRMLFPVDGSVDHFEAATTFDVAVRTPGPSDDEGWMQSPPATFPHQGFVHANGLSVVAPGLPEAEVIPGPPGKIAITLLRCVGSLSRLDLRSRPGPAGPGTDTPGAQCAGSLRAQISLFAGLDPAQAREAELGLRAVLCGDAPLAAESESLLEIEPSELVLSAFKPAGNGDGVVLRISNPTSTLQEARIELGFPFERSEILQLDETLTGTSPERDGRTLSLPIPPHALRTIGIF